MRRIRALPHPDVRRVAMAEALRAADPESVAMLLGFLARQLPGEDARAAWLDAVLALLGPVPAQPGEGLRRATDRLETHPLRAVFAFLALDPDLRRGADVTPDAYAYADVPLGVRKSRARGRSRDVLRQMCADPDPAVVAILLENPLAGESEALRVASRRPQAAANFLAVLASRRFGVREPVQAALVLNPWCPVRLALALVPLLTWPRLDDVASATALDARVRDAATAVRGGA